MANNAKNSIFITDPSFCPFCGLILPLPGLSKKLTCRLCGYNQNSESKDEKCSNFTNIFGNVHMQSLRTTLSIQSSTSLKRRRNRQGKRLNAQDKNKRTNGERERENSRCYSNVSLSLCLQG